MKLLRDLREMDRLYFGRRVGAGSAYHMAMAIITGFTPWGFVRRYYRGELTKGAKDATPGPAND